MYGLTACERLTATPSRIQKKWEASLYNSAVLLDLAPELEREWANYSEVLQQTTPNLSPETNPRPTNQYK